MRFSVPLLAALPNNYVVAGRIRLGLDPGTARL
jgi:hypothetical protein